MSSSPGAGYKLRPNKSVDRELFLSLMVRLGARLSIEDYLYIGLGGAYLEDFRMVHARTGITNMVSVDSDLEAHQRQKFNAPIGTVTCIHSTIEDYLDDTELNTPVVLWLDFTDPRKLQSQVELFSRQVAALPLLSLLRITINANPSSLGRPDPMAVAVQLEGEEGGDETRLTEQEWRLARFKERMPDYCPSGLAAEDMSQKNYGNALLQVLDLAAKNAVLPLPDRDILWCLATHYSDGQFMITATLLITSSLQSDVEGVVSSWEYHSTPSSPHVIDLPALSTLERLTMEALADPKASMGYELPKTYMDIDPFETFKKFYRVFPHFSRVEV